VQRLAVVAEDRAKIPVKFDDRRVAEASWTGWRAQAVTCTTLSMS
jgi:hypothetical protein